MPGRNRDDLWKTFLAEIESHPKVDQLPAGALEALNGAKDYAEERFASLGANFGYFTSHGPDHSARVLSYMLQLERLLGDFRFSAREMVIAGLAAYLHDIGMTCPISGAVDMPNHERMDQRRVRHAFLVQSMLSEDGGRELRSVRSMDETCYDVFLPIICRAHATEEFVPAIKSLAERSRMDMTTRYGLIASLLFFADELDLDRERAVGPLVSMYDEFCSVTKAHCWKHWCTKKCTVKGLKVTLICSTREKFRHVKEFAMWNVAKLSRQLDLLRSAVDPFGTSFWKELSIETLMIDETDLSEFPECSDKVLGVCLREIDKLELDHNLAMQDAKRLRNRISETEFNRHASSSDAYRKIVRPHESVFRGQGMLSSAERIVGTYVEVPENISNMDSILGQMQERAAFILSLYREYSTRVPGSSGMSSPPRMITEITGGVGVGKTHFISVLANRFRERFPDLHKSSCIVRVECIGLHSIRAVKEKLLFSYVDSLDNHLRVYDTIKKVSSRSNGGVRIPSSANGCVGWSEKEIEGAITWLSLFLGSRECKESLGTCLPTFVFLDNSDHLRIDIVADLYGWLYGLAGDSGVFITLCYRPETRDRLQRQRASQDDRSPRPPTPVYPAPVRDVILRRFEYICESCLGNTVSPVEITDCTILGSSRVEIVDAKKAILHLAALIAEGKSDFLAALAGTNFRVGLVALVRVLNSHVVTSDDFLMALTESNDKDNEVRTGWPRRFEGLILGHRYWFDGNLSYVENLFCPPGVEKDRSHFLALHVLKLLMRQPGPFPVGELYGLLEVAGYDRSRVDSCLQWLSMRVIPDDAKQEARICPLVELTDDGIPVSAFDIGKTFNYKACVTPWGKYHVDTAIWQLRYWKHIVYDTLVPTHIENDFRNDGVDLVGKHLRHNLTVFFSYLGTEEQRWHNIYPRLSSELKLKLKIGEIKKHVFRQF